MFTLLRPAYMHGSRTRTSGVVHAALGSKRMRIHVHDEDQQCLGMHMRYMGTSIASGCTEWYSGTNKDGACNLAKAENVGEGKIYCYL
jgi:hypothetical protein